jgi:RNA polymerase sigma-70 factor (ECF subfamily)
LSNFEARSSARTWLLSIARRACADSVRRRIRRRRLLERVRPAPEVQGGDEPLVELTAVLAGMEPGRREAFVVTQLLGLSYAEAADVCGCVIGTIRSRVARAREELVGAFDLSSDGGQLPRARARRDPNGRRGNAGT